MTEATTTHKFKIVGAQEGKTVRLGANGQYAFKKGICTITCNAEDAKRHQLVLGRYYSAKRVRSKEEVVEDDAPAAAAPSASKSTAKSAASKAAE